MRLAWIPLLLAVVLSGCGGERRLVIESVQQGREPTTSFGFTHEHWLQRDLWALREREGLDALREAAEDDWALQLALCNWTRDQFEPGYPDPYPRANALHVLDEIRAGRTQGFCGQYAYVLADALKSLGLFEVRYLELQAADGETHSSLEVWSDRWQRWFVLDPYSNAYYSLGDGVPLSALEIHEQMIAGKGAAVVSHILGDQVELASTEKIVNFHHRFAVSMRNNLADAALPPTIADRQASYLLHHCEASPIPEGTTFNHSSSESGDFESPRNQTYLDCEPAAEQDRGFDCRISTRGTVAHLGTLLVTEDGETWLATGSRHDWNPGEGDALSALAVSDQGWMSRPATVRAVKR